MEQEDIFMILPRRTDLWRDELVAGMASTRRKM